MMDYCSLMKTMLIASVAANLLVAVVATAAAVTDHQVSVDKPGEHQQQQIDLGPITSVHSEVAKLNLPKPLECRLFASRVSQVVGEQTNHSQQDVLARLAHSLDSQSDTEASTSGDQVDTSKPNSELVEYVNECVRSMEAENSHDVTSRMVATHELLDMAKERMAKLEVELREHQVAKEMTAKEVSSMEAQIAKWKGQADEFSVQFQQEQQKVAKLELELKQHEVAKETTAKEMADLKDRNSDLRDQVNRLEAKQRQHRVDMKAMDEKNSKDFYAKAKSYASKLWPGK